MNIPQFLVLIIRLLLTNTFVFEKHYLINKKNPLDILSEREGGNLEDKNLFVTGTMIDCL